MIDMLWKAHPHCIYRWPRTSKKTSDASEINRLEIKLNEHFKTTMGRQKTMLRQIRRLRFPFWVQLATRSNFPLHLFLLSAMIWESETVVKWFYPINIHPILWHKMNDEFHFFLHRDDENDNDSKIPYLRFWVIENFWLYSWTATRYHEPNMFLGYVAWRAVLSMNDNIDVQRYPGSFSTVVSHLSSLVQLKIFHKSRLNSSCMLEVPKYVRHTLRLTGCCVAW